MKQAKKLTRRQKEIVYSQGLNVDEWALRKESSSYLFLIHKATGQRRTVDNFIHRR